MTFKKNTLMHSLARGRAAAVLAVLSLAGCAVVPAHLQTPAARSSAPAPAARAATAPAAVPAPRPIEMPLPAAAPAASQPEEPKPAAPGFSGPVDARTGMRQNAVVAVTGNADRGFSVLFRPDRTEPASVEGVAGRLCGDAGVASARTNTSGGSSAMPGVKVMVVKCG
ncbi:hypothetical protein [Paracoccus salsus]|uniref:hypothetical protein n=1 Tax=Paracoccus salsus TaxID=2911061 RepID=UPI001F26AE19|nr:hypothetical protein [Paracoccus salsus]MCF3974089.1 hypothetical protein [Paracoccus salsus]